MGAGDDVPWTDGRICAGVLAGLEADVGATLTATEVLAVWAADSVTTSKSRKSTAWCIFLILPLVWKKKKSGNIPNPRRFYIHVTCNCMQLQWRFVTAHA